MFLSEDCEELDDDEMEECELFLEPIVEDGVLVAIAMFQECSECGEVDLLQIFTDGSFEMEEVAWELGLREHLKCEEI